MNAHEFFSRHHGKKFKYDLDKDTSANFEINADLVQYFEPIQHDGKAWYQVADIAWGQGYHSVLYGSLDGNLVATNDGDVSKITYRYNIKDDIETRIFKENIFGRFVSTGIDPLEVACLACKQADCDVRKVQMLIEAITDPKCDLLLPANIVNGLKALLICRT